MNGIVFVLFLIANILNANIDERDGRSAKGLFVSMKRTYWAEQQEEASEKKRKKYRLGAAANKESGGASKRQLIEVKTSMLEDKVRLSYDPVVYRSEKNLHFAQHEERLQLISQVRYLNFYAQPITKLNRIYRE